MGYRQGRLSKFDDYIERLPNGEPAITITVESGSMLKRISRICLCRSCNYIALFSVVLAVEFCILVPESFTAITNPVFLLIDIIIAITVGVFRAVVVKKVRQFFSVLVLDWFRSRVCHGTVVLVPVRVERYSMFR